MSTSTGPALPDPAPVPDPAPDPAQSPTPASTPGLADRLRRERYLARVSWAMQDYPCAAFKQIKRELRAEVSAAASDVGMEQALRDLGHPRVLAEGYIAQLGHRLPRYVSGALAAALAVAGLAYLAMAYAFGTLDTLGALGGGSVTTEPLGAVTTFTHTDTELSVQTSMTWQVALLYAVTATIAFVLGSRLWRLRGRRTQRAVARWT